MAAIVTEMALSVKHLLFNYKKTPAGGRLGLFESALNELRATSL